ncbi:hypothetical protein EIP86_000239 [Pleurotus ostreatoroseus]|nr:hypothetical protein EIP86_000239 [Pleurotus ostreatoroseus]
MVALVSPWLSRPHRQPPVSPLNETDFAAALTESIGTPIDPYDDGSWTTFITFTNYIMPLFKKKTDAHKSSNDYSDWDDWRNEVPQRGTRRGDPSGSERRQSMSSPRGILRNSVGNIHEEPRRHSVANATASPQTAQGRDRFRSLPVSNSLSSMPPPRNDPSPHSFTNSSSLSRLDAKSRAPEAGYANETSSHRRPSLALDRRVSGLSSEMSSHSRSQFRPRQRTLSRSLSRDGVPRHAPETRFPMPPIQRAIRDLSRILRDRTKRFRLKDHLEPEEIVSGRIWEEEEETLVDCVRDRIDDEDGQDGVWRLDRKSRQMKQQALRDKTHKAGNTFGAHVQDLPTTAMTRVSIGGYAHVVPLVVNACVEELYRTGAYKPHLFRSLPNRTRLYELVARFDLPAPPNLANELNDPSTKIYAKTPSLHSEQTADLCALLVTYLSALPDSLIHRSLCDGLWAWCVSPSIIRQEQRIQRNCEDEASESEYDTTEDEDENAPSYNTRLRQMEFERMNIPPLKVQILIAQHVLLLLPPRHFSLLAHLMTFFATLLVSPENGLSADDIGRIFGPIVMARKHHTQGGGDEEDAGQTRRVGDMREKERKTMVWLVNHWERISTAYEAKHARDMRRARSASVGEELDLRRQSSQGHDDYVPNRSVNSAIHESPSKPRPPPLPEVSSPFTEHEQGRRRRATLPPDNAAHLSPYPPRPEPMTSGSTASSTSESEYSEMVPSPSIKYAEQSGKVAQRRTSVRIRDPDECIVDGLANELTAAFRIENDVDIYSNDDIVENVVDRYLDGPEDPKPGSNSAVGSDSGHHVRQQDVGDLGMQNANLRRKLEQVLKERDQARDMVAAMRRVVHD